MVGVAGQKRVPDDCFRDLRVPVTDLTEQRTIADYLDAETARIDALVTRQRRMRDLLRKRRQMVITLAVTRKIGPGAASRSESAEEVRPLRAYAEVALGRQRSPQHEQGPYMVPYLRAANVKDGTLDLGDVMEMNFSLVEQEVFSLRPGDVLVTEGSGSLGAVGASAVWSGEVEGRVCFQNTLLRLRPRPGTDARFLAWWCRHAFADGMFASVAVGANIFHISAERVRSLPVTYVELPTQRAIASYLETETGIISSLIEKIEHQIDLLRERRQALITAAVSGEIDVPGLVA